MKELIFMCGPFSSRSGYGNHARDIFKAIHMTDKYDIKCLDVRWGDCPRNALSEDTQFNTTLKSTFVESGPKGVSLPKQPDVYIDVRIPNEFQKWGKKNIGITAGVETDAVSAAWLEACNKMDCVITVSEHSKSGFTTSKYDKINNLPDGKQQKIGEMKLEKPMEVLFEGLDETKYFNKKSSEISEDLKKSIDSIPENFAYLMVGQWCQGNFGEDRKDIPRAVKIFYETFANRTSPPALIIKTSGATQSLMDRETCLNKLKQIKSKFPEDIKLPNIYLLHGNLSDEEMNDLYNHHKVKAFYLITHGEGFGRPLLEASFTGLPIITSNWSGQLDFLPGDKAVLVPGEVVPVPKAVHWKDIIVPESKWFVADANKTAGALNYVFENYNIVKKRAVELMEENRSKFTMQKMSEKLDSILSNVLKDVPQQVSLNLPKLKKKTTPPKIKLPKLKKASV